MKRHEFHKHTEEILMRRRDALRRVLAGDMRMLRSEQGGHVGDEIDAALATEQAELQSQMASHESRELANIEHALTKMKAGEYGRCESCERAIAPMRLTALPYATECIECARKDEARTSVHLGRHTPVNRIAKFADESESVDEAAYEEIG